MKKRAREFRISRIYWTGEYCVEEKIDKTIEIFGFKFNRKEVWEKHLPGRPFKTLALAIRYVESMKEENNTSKQSMYITI